MADKTLSVWYLMPTLSFLFHLLPPVMATEAGRMSIPSNAGAFCEMTHQVSLDTMPQG